MKINFHPGPESLMSCSAGSMPEAFAAVMASHISMCPSCRKDLALMQDIGVALFDQIEPTSVSKPAPVLALRAGEADRGGDAIAVVEKGDVPAPLAPAVGNYLAKVTWRRIGAGVWQHQIPLSDPSRGTLRLIKVAAGQVLPEHGHDGSEMTLVLSGSFSDRSGNYRVGDVADLGQDAEHAPVADAEAGCVCLVATEGKMRFKSRIARLVQPFTGF